MQLSTNSLECNLRMVIHCKPVRSEKGEILPFLFIWLALFLDSLTHEIDHDQEEKKDKIVLPVLTTRCFLRAPFLCLLFSSVLPVLFVAFQFLFFSISLPHSLSVSCSGISSPFDAVIFFPYKYLFVIPSSLRGMKGQSEMHFTISLIVLLLISLCSLSFLRESAADTDGCARHSARHAAIRCVVRGVHGRLHGE